MTIHETLDPPAATIVHQASFHELMASVGYLLLQWGLLDRGLDEEITQLRRAAGDIVSRPCRQRTLNERLAEWRALIGRGRRRAQDQQAIDEMGLRIQEHHRLRNLVATGLVSTAAEDGAPAIRCTQGPSRQGAADEIRFDLADMLDTIEAMEACRAQMTLMRDLGRH